MNGDLSKEELEEKLKSIEDKLDLIIDRLNNMNGIKDFGISVLANIVGNRIDGNKR